MATQAGRKRNIAGDAADACKAPRLMQLACDDRSSAHGSDATAATPLRPSPTSCRQRLAWLRAHKAEPAVLLGVAIDLTNKSLAATLAAVQDACAVQSGGDAPDTACSALDRAEALMETTLRRTSITLRLAAAAVGQQVEQQPHSAVLLPQALQHHTTLLQLMATLQQQRAVQGAQDERDDESDSEVTSSFVPAATLSA